MKKYIYSTKLKGDICKKQIDKIIQSSSHKNGSEECLIGKVGGNTFMYYLRHRYTSSSILTKCIIGYIEEKDGLTYITCHFKSIIFSRKTINYVCVSALLFPGVVLFIGNSSEIISAYILGLQAFGIMSIILGIISTLIPMLDYKKEELLTPLRVNLRATKVDNVNENIT